MFDGSVNPKYSRNSVRKLILAMVCAGVDVFLEGKLGGGGAGDLAPQGCHQQRSLPVVQTSQWRS
jgi:hypothetical protein